MFVIEGQDGSLLWHCDWSGTVFSVLIHYAIDNPFSKCFENIYAIDMYEHEQNRICCLIIPTLLWHQGT